MVPLHDHDGKPFLKVIDFGIAKATNQRLTEKTFSPVSPISSAPRFI
jgi:hypothetical protein